MEHPLCPRMQLQLEVGLTYNVHWLCLFSYMYMHAHMYMYTFYMYIVAFCVYMLCICMHMFICSLTEPSFKEVANGYTPYHKIHKLGSVVDLHVIKKSIHPLMMLMHTNQVNRSLETMASRCSKRSQTSLYKPITMQ